MAQLYRALYEIREMNLWNTIKTKIWQADNVSFELFVEKHQLSFYVVVNKYYRSIVEKQITTFYKDADIKVSKEPYSGITRIIHCSVLVPIAAFGNARQNTKEMRLR